MLLGACNRIQGLSSSTRQTIEAFCDADPDPFHPVGKIFSFPIEGFGFPNVLEHFRENAAMPTPHLVDQITYF